MADDLIEEQVNPALETKLPRYNYGIVLECDFVNDKKKQEIVDVACIACEKHSPMEKSRKERNNEAAAAVIKVMLVSVYLTELLWSILENKTQTF